MQEKKKNRYAYINNHKKTHYRRIIALIPLSDEKVIEKIQNVKTSGSLSNYIYELIKKDIEKDD